jgi:alkylation response protein AidB-like acyl-CoA dehydrogenase
VTNSTANTVRLLEQSFGDPWESGSPLSFATSLAADESAVPVTTGEAILADLDIIAEFVPVAYGGRLAELERVAQILRSLARRDTALAFSLATSAVLAAGTVWSVGSAQQCERTARLLLANRRLACAPRDLIRADNFGLAATVTPAGMSVSGRQEMIGISAADAVVSLVQAQYGNVECPVLLDVSELPAMGVRVSAVRPLPGLPGISIGDVTYTDCRVEAALGERGVDIRSIARILVPSMAIGIVDTALRVAVTYAGNRKLYGGTVLDFPRTKAILAEVFADLLLCDALCSVVTRALHLAPQQASRYALVVQLLVPRLLVSAMTTVSELLGSMFYLRDGEFGIVQKLLRDTRTIAFDFCSCLASERALRTDLSRTANCQASLFALGCVVPELEFTSPAERGGDDPILSALASFPDLLPASVRDLAQRFLEDSTQLTAPRYAATVAASACIGVWLDGSSVDPSWVHLALARLGASTPRVPAAARANLFAELIWRHERALTLDLHSYQTTA